ncbi:hypothetical protein AB0B21_34890 [Streptomyces rimosus]|uniref:hypothetical protein n=1 Tax=Streptomyces rimosus TaxID=1927 RepID=UPI000519B137|nr:hypothetical protein [Streptomyces rimosus]
MRPPLLTADTVRALATFVQARTQEGVEQLLQHVSADQHDSPGVTKLLRTPRALGRAADLAARELEGELLGDPVDENAVRLLWWTLLNTAHPFRAHPDVPAGAREVLEATAGYRRDTGQGGNELILTP